MTTLLLLLSLLRAGPSPAGPYAFEGKHPVLVSVCFQSPDKSWTCTGYYVDRSKVWDLPICTRMPHHKPCRMG